MFLLVFQLGFLVDLFDFLFVFINFFELNNSFIFSRKIGKLLIKLQKHNKELTKTKGENPRIVVAFKLFQVRLKPKSNSQTPRPYTNVLVAVTLIFFSLKKKKTPQKFRLSLTGSTPLHSPSLHIPAYSSFKSLFRAHHDHYPNHSSHRTRTSCLQKNQFHHISIQVNKLHFILLNEWQIGYKLTPYNLPNKMLTNQCIYRYPIKLVFHEHTFLRVLQNEWFKS